MNETKIENYAEELKKCREKVTTISPLTEKEEQLSLKEAYQIQLHQVDKRIEDGETIVGKKIGLTSDAMQEMLGVDEPDYGHLFDTMVIPEEEAIKLNTLIQPKCEAELAFVLADDLKGPGVTVADVLGATKGVIPAFEIIDSRIKDWRLKIQDTIADNASSGLLVLGSRLNSIEGINLKHTGLVVRKNGKIIDTAAGAAVLGDPAQAVAWLANKLSEYDIYLKAGEVILSGSFTGAFPVVSGDAAIATFDSLGSVSVVFK